MKRTPTQRKKARAYDNSSRADKSNSNRQKIIENYIALLVERKGNDISLEELAEKADLSIRTLFRFFGDKKSLALELEAYLERYVSQTSEALQVMSLEEFAEHCFQVFDRYENLMLAYLYTNFGQTSRALFRIKFNNLLLEKIKSQVTLKNTPEEQLKLHFIITLINANLWSDLRDTYGENGQAIAATVKWAIKTLLKNLNNQELAP